MINLKELLKLSPSDRILMVEKIWDSLNPDDIDMKKEHKKELDNRLNRYKNGKTKFYSWNDIKEDLNS